MPAVRIRRVGSQIAPFMGGSSPGCRGALFALPAGYTLVGVILAYPWFWRAAARRGGGAWWVDRRNRPMRRDRGPRRLGTPGGDGPRDLRSAAVTGQTTAPAVAATLRRWWVDHTTISEITRTGVLAGFRLVCVFSSRLPARTRTVGDGSFQSRRRGSDLSSSIASACWAPRRRFRYFSSSLPSRVMWVRDRRDIGHDTPPTPPAYRKRPDKFRGSGYFSRLRQPSWPAGTPTRPSAGRRLSSFSSPSCTQSTVRTPCIRSLSIETG